MLDRRPVYISIAVILVLLLVVLPAGAAAVGKDSSTAQGTAASSAEAGSGTKMSAVAPPEQTPQPADKETTVRDISTVPTSSTKPTTETKAVVVTTTAPALRNNPPENSDSRGSGDETVRTRDATTVPTATPSVIPSAGSGARTEGNDPGKTAGGSASTSDRTAVPTATTTNSGSTQARTSGDGAGQGSPDGKEATATSTAGAKTGSTATAAPPDAPAAIHAGGGSGPAGGGTTEGTGWPLAGPNGANQAFSDPAEPSVAGNGGLSVGIGSNRGPGPGSSVAAAGAASGVTVYPKTSIAGPGGPRPVTVTGVAGNRPQEQVNRSGIASGHGAGAGNVAAHGGPFPTVSPSPFNMYASRPGSEVGAARAVRSGDPGDDGMRGDPRPQNAGRERGPPALPAAAPVRTGLEPLSQGPGESGGGRGRRDLPALPSTAETNDGVPDPLLLLRFLLFLGYRRIRPGNVLDHPMRRDLASAIVADPGLDLAGCVAVTGANRETLRYHLALLVCAGKVMEETRNGSVRYFPHDPTLTPSHRAVLHLDRNPSLAPLLHHIRDVPGISRKDLAERLGVAGPSVNRQVQRLVDEGLVERRRVGQSQRYWLTPDAAGAFATIAMAEAPRDGVLQTRDRASA